MGTYNSDPSVYTLANAVAQDADAKGKLYSKAFEVSGNTADDLSAMEGAPGSTMPVWVRNELKALSGDTIKFTSLGDPSGPGVRGEGELTGNTSTPRIGGWSLSVDFWRDAVEFTKKEISFLAAGGKLEYEVRKLLGKKFGRQKQADMLMALRNQANGNVYRAGNRASRNAILATDKYSTSIVTQAQARARGIGAQPVGITKSKSGSELQRYIAFCTQDAMSEIRNSSTFITAMQTASARSDDNPQFSGRLVDWNGVALFEHTVVSPDSDDWKGSPLAPYAVLGVEITAASTAFDIKVSSTNTKNLYFGFFEGYDWKWTETQTAAPDSTVYYAWIIPQDGANVGKAMFVSYVGTGNNGNKITITERLGSSAAGAQVTTLGTIAWASGTRCESAPVGSVIIPANSIGTPIGHSLTLGAGSGIRAYGAIEMQKIEQKRDYEFVTGFGYEGIFGQSATKDTQGLTRNYVLVQHALERAGVTIPGTYGV
jgi:N4-gp56 family major capsid protein